MSAWGRVFAAGYDHIMSGPEKATLRTHREALIPQANGQVLEIGGGTGANLPFYKSTATITLTEPEKPMMRRLARRLRERSQDRCSYALRPRICRSTTTASMWPSPPSCSARSTTNRGRYANSGECSSPAAAYSSSSMCAPMTIVLPDGRTG